ncbi:hypothetical protein HDU77_001559 [Chytriomyces hyalinus]|nr:hypothetical protein HDU77_001559 [Chytriomyces hyalinus]
MDPLTTMHAFESSSDSAIDETTSCQGSIARSPTFETMPPEMLDRIVQFVDGKSILPLCHALPYFKYISTAMFDFARRFPEEKYTPSKLWPNIHLHKAGSMDSEITEFPIRHLETTKFPIQHIHAAAVYARIVSKHGGIVHVSCSKDVLNYLGAFPDVVSVHPSYEASNSVWGEFMRALADANKQIRSCTVDVEWESHEELVQTKQQEEKSSISYVAGTWMA